MTQVPITQAVDTFFRDNGAMHANGMTVQKDLVLDRDERILRQANALISGVGHLDGFVTRAELARYFDLVGDLDGVPGMSWAETQAFQRMHADMAIAARDTMGTGSRTTPQRPVMDVVAGYFNTWGAGSASGVSTRTYQGTSGEGVMREFADQFTSGTGARDQWTTRHELAEYITNSVDRDGTPGLSEAEVGALQAQLDCYSGSPVC